MTAPLVAVIPARAGSSRMVGKNTRPFAGKPLIRWTIEAAQRSGVPFDEIVVNSDDPECHQIAGECGVGTYWRSRHLATDTTSMRETLLDFALNAWAPDYRVLDESSLMVLYPTYPLRTAADVREAHEAWARACDGGRLGLIGTIRGGLEARAVDALDPDRVRARYPEIYRTQDSPPGLTRGETFCHFVCVVPVRHLGACSPQLITDRDTVRMPLDLPPRDWRDRCFEVDTEEDWEAAELRVAT